MKPTNRPLFAVLAAVATLISGSSSCLAGDVLFCKVSRNYGESGILGKVYRKEIETRMFAHKTWRQRLYYSSYDPSSNETLEVYSKSDGSRWLSHCIARPSLTQIIGRRIWLGEHFDLKRELDAIPITRQEVRLPQTVARELEALWNKMLPGCEAEPIARDLYIHAPVFIGFARERRSVSTGKIVPAAYDTELYRSFVDLVTDLRKVCASGGSQNSILQRLPKKIKEVSAKLSTE